MTPLVARDNKNDDKEYNDYIERISDEMYESINDQIDGWLKDAKKERYDSILIDISKEYSHEYEEHLVLKHIIYTIGEYEPRFKYTVAVDEIENYDDDDELCARFTFYLNGEWSECSDDE